MKTNKGLNWDNGNGNLGHLYRHDVQIVNNKDDYRAWITVYNTSATLIKSVNDLKSLILIERISATGYVKDGSQYYPVNAIIMNDENDLTYVYCTPNDGWTEVGTTLGDNVVTDRITQVF